MESFCLTLRFWRIEHVLSSSLLCGDIGHCFLFLLMAVVLFTIREKQDATFSVAADSPQIRLHIPKHEIAWFYSVTLHKAFILRAVMHAMGVLTTEYSSRTCFLMS